MSELEGQIKTFALAELRTKIEEMGISTDEIGDDFNLVHSGLLDSMGFVEFALRIEEEFGIEIDFADQDPGQFTTLAGLARCAASARAGRDA